MGRSIKAASLMQQVYDTSNRTRKAIQLRKANRMCLRSFGPLTSGLIMHWQTHSKQSSLSETPLRSLNHASVLAAMSFLQEPHLNSQTDAVLLMHSFSTLKSTQTRFRFSMTNQHALLTKWQQHQFGTHIVF